MKTEEILLAGGLAIGAWYLFIKKAEAQPIQELLSGGGGGGFDLSSLLAGLNLGAGISGGLPQFSMPQMPNFSFNLGDLGLGGGGLDMSGLGDFLKNLGLGGAGAGGSNINDTITKAIKDATKSWTDPWGGITDPLHQANVNLANTGKGITESINAVTAVARTSVGGFTNALTGKSPWYSYLFGPVGAVIGGMWTEAGEIVNEKNAAQGTVTLGPETLKTIQQYGSEAAMHAAALEKLKSMTPQKQAAAQEVNLGRTSEGPSGLYSGNAGKGYAAAQPVQTAKIIDLINPTIRGNIGYA